MFLKLRTYLKTFWKTYVLLATPLLLIPIIFNGLKERPLYEHDSSGNLTQFLEDLPMAKSEYEPMVCAYVLLLMAIYWMTEVLPLPITALIPVVAFPLFGVMSTSEVAMNYMRATNFMMLGGLMLGVCVEHSGLHKRIALRIILFLGTSPKMILFGFMITTAFVSMWISNGATAAMMVPIIDAFVAVLHNSEEEVNDIEMGHSGHIKPTRIRTKEEESLRNLLLLSVAYSACIGGTGVITGNPSNLVILEVLPPKAGINFATWMSFTVPLMMVNLFLAWIWLSQMSKWTVKKKEPELILPIDTNANGTFRGANQHSDHLVVNVDEIIPQVTNFIVTPVPQSPKLITKRHQNEVQERVTKVMRHHYTSLGPTTIHEWSIVVCFALLIVLWFFRQPMFIHGWGDNLRRITDRGTVASVADATPAMFLVIMVFILPIHYQLWPFQALSLQPRRSPSLVTWKIVEKKMPWGVLLFLGGGFALSDACTKTGFSTWLVQYLVYLRRFPVWVINLIVSIFTATITEVVSNTAAANILLPILKEMSLTLCNNPTYLVLSSVITCCYAFMLPVATAPAAIVFEASTMTTGYMMKAGLPMNFICVLTTNIAINTYGSYMFNLGEFPEWAMESAAESNINCTGIYKT